MIYSNVCGEKISKLGFGTMRLPLNEDKTINQKQVEEMVDYALNNGVNYFDTAYPYHEGQSEISIGKALKKYPRESYYLADKYPGHQIASSYNPAQVFETQLKKCDVEYFDFYLLHNVYENDIEVYEDPKWGIIDYFVEQKKLGRIKHLGFSSHARVETLENFLKRHPNLFEFCQIQLNYVDYTLQEGKQKVELLNRYNIPIWVMEPLRGGKLASTKKDEKLKELRKDASIASWGFNYLLNIEGISVILSGMSSLSQMQDNIKTFNENKPLNEEETKLVYEIAEEIKSSVPCTKCRYCTSGCPMGIDIPLMIAIYNDLSVQRSVNTIMAIENYPEDKLPSACLKCGACASICPQGIKIPDILEDLTNIISSMPKWKDISKQREEIANKELKNKSS